ncbi:MAG: hypothetical protein J7485_03540 [Sphingobium sp.]|nr:hypothetical protein [Sphingobium sp.]
MDDDALHTTGLWLHAALSARWQRIEALGFAVLNPAFTYQLIAMAANRAELEISRRLDAAIADTRGDTPFYGIAALRLGDRDEEAATADMRRTGLIDTLGKAVATAGIAFRPDQPAFGVDEMREALDNFTDIYLLEFLWSRVLWLGWSLEGAGPPYRFIALEPDRVGEAMVVADWRREQVAAEFAATYAMEWSSPESVLRPCWEVRARAVPGGLGFRARQVAAGRGRLSPATVTLEILKAGELGPYLDRPLPLVEGEVPLSLRDVVEGWELLSLAASDAERLLRQAPAHGGANRLSLALPINVLVDLLGNLGWSRGKCLAVIDFLTFKERSQDGVWTKPLLRFGTRRLMLLTPLVSCNLLRVAELWAAEGAGEVLFAERGNEFEARLRASLAKSLANRSWSGDAMVLESAWEPRIDKVSRDIDLAFRIGNVVFIGEIKLKRYPNSAAEVGRYLREFEKAAGQLDIRLSYLRQNLVEVSRRTAYAGDPTDLRIAGFILSGTPFGAGMSVGGYPVVDRDALDFFFDNDFFLSFATVERASGYEGRPAAPGTSIRLVDDDPATCMLGYLLDPLHVRHAEHGLRRIERHNRLKVTGEALSWPEGYVEPPRPDAEAARAITTYLSSMKEDAQRRARAQLALDEG